MRLANEQAEWGTTATLAGGSLSTAVTAKDTFEGAQPGSGNGWLGDYQKLHNRLKPSATGTEVLSQLNRLNLFDLSNPEIIGWDYFLSFLSYALSSIYSVVCVIDVQCKDEMDWHCLHR